MSLLHRDGLYFVAKREILLCHESNTGRPALCLVSVLTDPSRLFLLDKAMPCLAVKQIRIGYCTEEMAVNFGVRYPN